MSLYPLARAVAAEVANPKSRLSMIRDPMSIVVTMLSLGRASEIMSRAILPKEFDRWAATCELADLLWNIPDLQVFVLDADLYLTAGAPRFIDFMRNSGGWMMRMPDPGFTIRCEQFPSARALISWYRNHCVNAAF